MWPPVIPTPWSSLYKSIAQPFFFSCSPCFFTTLTVANRNKLIRITCNASHLKPLKPQLQSSDTQSTHHSQGPHSTPEPTHLSLTIRSKVQVPDLETGTFQKELCPFSCQSPQQTATFSVICFSFYPCIHVNVQAVTTNFPPGTIKYCIVKYKSHLI